MTDLPLCNNLIILVGGNPLPNYYVAAMMRPKEKLYLLHTKGSEPQMERLKKVLIENEILAKDKKAAEDKIKPLIITRSKGDTILKEVRDFKLPAGENDYLNYTGGTKAMGVFSTLAWLNHSDRYKNLCYLDDEEKKLVFDNGEYYPIARAFEGDKIPIPADLLFKLHFANLGFSMELAPTEEDKVFETKIINLIKGVVVKNFHTAKFWSNYKIKKSRRVYCEIDSIVVNQGRICFISISGSKYLEPNKEHLWEIFYWSKYLGGDLARPALITEFPDPEGTLKECVPINEQETVRLPIRIFGPSHTKEWEKNNFDSLIAWFKE